MTDEDFDICGSTNTSTGEPCQRPAGWGTDRDYGPCKQYPRDGRPSKFTAERRDQVIQRAKKGATKEGCARAAGISYRTLHRWLERGESEDYQRQVNRLPREIEHDVTVKLDTSGVHTGNGSAVRTHEIYVNSTAHFKIVADGDGRATVASGITAQTHGKMSHIELHDTDYQSLSQFEGFHLD